MGAVVDVVVDVAFDVTVAGAAVVGEVVIGELVEGVSVVGIEVVGSFVGSFDGISFNIFLCLTIHLFRF